MKSGLKSLLHALVATFILIVGLALLAIGGFALDYNVIRPKQYSRLQAEAATWNGQNWETGYALQVSVQVTSTTATGTNTATETLVCYEKKFADPGGLEAGPPRIYGSTYSDGAALLTVAFGSSALHQTELRELCGDAFAHAAGWRLPHSIDSPYYWSYVLPIDQSYQCFLGDDPRTTKGEVTRPKIVAVEKLSLRDLMDLATYTALPKYEENRQHWLRNKFGWYSEQSEKCWRGEPKDTCAPEVEAVCGRPFR